MFQSAKKSVAVIVAHPDDETLWAGGIILLHPAWNWFIVCLCRGSDENRAPKFYQVLKILNSKGMMGDLDDGPEQNPLKEQEVDKSILDLLPEKQFDLILTHHPNGEYTRHLRHEEISRAVINLWFSGKIVTRKLWTFAYEDHNQDYYPRPVEHTSIYRILPDQIWTSKHKLITEAYGFTEDSWESQTTPKAESFWQFSDPLNAHKWLQSVTKELKPDTIQNEL